jgi:CheY-like chemotaxis protein
METPGVGTQPAVEPMPARVLLVDDTPSNRLALEAALENADTKL